MSPEEITDGLNLANSSGGNPPTFNPGGPIVDGTIVTQIGQATLCAASRPDQADTSDRVKMRDATET